MRMAAKVKGGRRLMPESIGLAAGPQGVNRVGTTLAIANI
jgi:hypothetical protein